MSVLVVYESMTGNTKDLAEIIYKNLSDRDLNVSIYDICNVGNIDSYEHVYLGMYTYENGNLPDECRYFLREILIENDYNLPIFSLFGTGETQFGKRNYCRAVDSSEYHLSKKTKVIGKLKIEQNPVDQHSKIINFVSKTVKEVNNEIRKS